VDQRRRIGQPLAELMVIGDDQFQPQFARRLGLADAGDAAIDGDDHPRPALGQRTQRLVVQAVTFVNSMGHIVARLRAKHAQAIEQ
jgi:hypothetical protein